MRTALWQAYMRLQTDLVSVCGVHTCEPAHARRAAARLGAAAHLLIVGPGGPAEVEALRPVCATPTALVARGDEAHAILDDAITRFQAVTTIAGDVHDMAELSADSFDALFCSNVLEHAFAPYIALMECRRVVRAGGAAYFVMPPFDSPSGSGGTGPYHLHCLDERVWRELLVKTGWSVAAVHHERVGAEPCMDFHCTACALPEPHDRVLADIRAVQQQSS